MADSPLPEQLFGKYRLLGVMNAGGMAELYLALQAGPEGFAKVVALKRVLPHLAQSHEFVEMFMDEARLAARLDHPHIVRIYDFGEAAGQYFMAMEYLPGEDLANILWRAAKAKQPIPSAIAAYITQAAAEGLHFAHELTDADGHPLGLVHRDANPTNILITYQGVVKVVDFGIAKAMGNVNQTEFGRVKGKAAYLAPEQVYGEPLDRRADVFCLGIVLWECLTGERLFQRDSDIASAHASTLQVPPPPSQRRPGLPPELDRIALKALAKQREERFQTAGELQDALEQYFRSGAVKPSAKEISAWLETLYGAPRAEAKRAIAQGRNLATAVPQVMKPLLLTPAPRPLPFQGTPAPIPLTVLAEGPESAFRTSGGATPALQTGSRLSSHPEGSLQTGEAPAVPQAGARPSLAGRGALALLLVVLAGGGLWGGNKLIKKLGAPRAERVATPGFASLAVDSLPEGAFIFLGGEPTGQLTPATLEQLSGDSVQIRLELSGYEPARETVGLEAGKRASRRYTLSPRPGSVAVRGVPENAELLVDGQPAPKNRTLTLAPGKHLFLLKEEGQPDTSREVVLSPGEEKTVELSR